jgi:predicted nucleic acid-binding protein
VIIYLDTSALLKLIFVEDRDAEVREWFLPTQRAATSIITYAESCAAMSRRSRVTGPAAVDVAGTVDQWVALLNHYMDQIICLAVAGRSAGHLALAHGLRGMDAIHLSTAVDLRERLAAQGLVEQVAFASFDRRLLEAAEHEGFQTLGGDLR